MRSAKDMTSHTWKTRDPLEYKTPQLQDGESCGWTAFCKQHEALEIHVQSKSRVGMENIASSASLLETHCTASLMTRKQVAVSAASLLAGRFWCTLTPNAWANAEYKVSSSNRNRNQVTIIFLWVPVITRDNNYVTCADGPGV